MKDRVRRQRWERFQVRHCEKKLAVSSPTLNSKAIVKESSISSAHTLATHSQLSPRRAAHGVIVGFISIFMAELDFNPREMVLMIKGFIDSVLIWAMRTKKVIWK